MLIKKKDLNISYIFYLYRFFIYLSFLNDIIILY